MDNINAIGRNNFKFEVTWLSHPDFLNVVRQVWNGDMPDNSSDKVRGYLCRFKILIQKWNKDTFGIFEKKKTLLSDLDKVQQENMYMPNSRVLVNKEGSIKRQLYQVLRNEETFWA